MPLTAADVASWAKLPEGTPTGADLALMTRVIAAVSEHVLNHYVVTLPFVAFTSGQEQAILMQCARIWARRQTALGVAAFGDLGAIRVSRLDNDVAALLDPQWNFA